MSSIPVFVGIDYHPSGLQLVVKDNAGNDLLCARCADSVEAVRDRLAGVGEIKSVAIEACSGAADLAEELTSDAFVAPTAGSTGSRSRRRTRSAAPAATP